MDDIFCSEDSSWAPYEHWLKRFLERFSFARGYSILTFENRVRIVNVYANTEF